LSKVTAITQTTTPSTACSAADVAGKPLDEKAAKAN
jgi:hypothetical protein